MKTRMLARCSSSVGSMRRMVDAGFWLTRSCPPTARSRGGHRETLSGQGIPDRPDSPAHRLVHRSAGCLARALKLSEGRPKTESSRMTGRWAAVAGIAWPVRFAQFVGVTIAMGLHPTSPLSASRPTAHGDSPRPPAPSGDRGAPSWQRHSDSLSLSSCSTGWSRPALGLPSSYRSG
jgi:hypothetical protein